MTQEFLWMRLGDNAEYETQENIDEIAAILLEYGIIEVFRCNNYGITDKEIFANHNYISLFYGDIEAQPTRPLSDEELAALNKALQKPTYVFTIPVSWEVSSSYSVRALSFEQACKKADHLDLPADGEYIDGSFEVNYDCGKYMNENVFELMKVDKTPFEDLPLLVDTLKHDLAKDRLEERLKEGK